MTGQGQRFSEPFFLHTNILLQNQVQTVHEMKKKDLLLFFQFTGKLVNVLSSPSDASAGWQNCRTVALRLSHPKPTILFNWRLCFATKNPNALGAAIWTLITPKVPFASTKQIGWE